MMTRPRITAPTVPTDDDAAPDLPSQKAVPETRQFRLQVDRQTKASYPTFEAARDAGLIIKRAHPIVQVAVYDAAHGLNQIIVLSTTGEQ